MRKITEKIFGEKLKSNMRRKEEQRIVKGNERTLEYTLIRKNVKNLNMRVKPEGIILVSANPLVSAKYVDRFVLSHEGTIIKALDKYEKMKQNISKPLQYESGEKIYFLGESLHLLLEASKIEGVDKFGSFLNLRVKDTTDFSRKERVFKKWISRMQREVFFQVCDEIYPLFRSYGVKYPMVKIRAMKSRWGSCQPSKGVITLNAKMIAAPREAIEYVVLHEFAHFIHPNHSKDFYALVESMMPDWKQRREMLNGIA